MTNTQQQMGLPQPTKANPSRMYGDAHAMEALRETGYNSTTKALSELIDNSFDAGARNVVVVIVQVKGKHVAGQKNPSRRAVEIYVMDDGSGMTDTEMNRALMYGGRNQQGREGIGRFGVGLPQASINQCRRIDLWSWQESVGTPSHTQIDLDYQKTAGLEPVVPWPEPAVGQWEPAPKPIDVDLEDPAGIAESHSVGMAIPEFLQEAGVADEILGGDGATHGTIAGWSKLDAIDWATAKAVAERVAEELGRVYRTYLAPESMVTYDLDKPVGDDEYEQFMEYDDGRGYMGVQEAIDAGWLATTSPVGERRRLLIRVINRIIDDNESITGHKVEADFSRDLAGFGENGLVLTNDPTYRLPASMTTIKKWPAKDGSMTGDAPFRPYGVNPQDDVVFLPSKFRRGEYYPVIVRTSISTKAFAAAAKDGTSLGKIISRNTGASIIRGDRELELIDTFSEELQRRYVGMEVWFSSALDETLGVTNNKQSATRLRQMIGTVKIDRLYVQTLKRAIELGRITPDGVSTPLFPLAALMVSNYRAAFREAKQALSGVDKPGQGAGQTDEVGSATNVDRGLEDEDLTEKEREESERIRTGGEPRSEDELVDDFVDAVKRTGGEAEREEVRAMVRDLMEKEVGYAFLAEHAPDAKHFFRVEQRLGVAGANNATKIIWMNEAHPIWDRYLTAFRLEDAEIDALGEFAARDLVRQARGVFAALFLSWARQELRRNDAEQTLVAGIREDWGRVAKMYIEGSGTSSDSDTIFD